LFDSHNVESLAERHTCCQGIITIPFIGSY
jgi:hypothetical protein